MLKYKKELLLIVLSICVFIPVIAQTTSPYSRYGYGVLKDQATGPSKGMGGIGYGLRNKLGANPMNPASYSNVDSLTFLFDIGVDWTKAKLSDTSGSQTDDNGGLDYITMLFPVAKGLGVSFGLVPFSSVGYSYGNDVSTSDSPIGLGYASTYSGSGGLSQIYGGLGYATPLKGLSIGANASFLFGTLNHNKRLSFYDSSVNPSAEYARLRVRTFKFDFGIQYEQALSDRNKIVVGAVYSPSNSYKGKFEREHYELNSSGSILESDTTINNKAEAGFADTYGFGFTFMRDDRITLGADVTYQRWEKVKYTNLMNDAMDGDKRFNDRWKFAVGGEYMHNKYERSYFKRMKFRAGFNYSNSYLNYNYKTGDLNGVSQYESGGYKEYGVTVGFGFPFIENYYRTGRTSYINLNFEYKKLKPEFKGLINEEYFGVSLNVNINELWFRTRKID
jgi:hypothetical protein